MSNRIREDIEKRILTHPERKHFLFMVNSVEEMEAARPEAAALEYSYTVFIRLAVRSKELRDCLEMMRKYIADHPDQEGYIFEFATQAEVRVALDAFTELEDLLGVKIQIREKGYEKYERNIPPGTTRNEG